MSLLLKLLQNTNVFRKMGVMQLATSRDITTVKGLSMSQGWDVLLYNGDQIEVLGARLLNTKRKQWKDLLLLKRGRKPVLTLTWVKNKN